MPRYGKNSDRETDTKAGYRTRGTANTETVDFPLRRSSRVKSTRKQNESSPESPSSTCSNISNAQSLRNTKCQTDTLTNSTMTERSKSLRLQKSSIVSDAVKTLDKHCFIGTPMKRTRNISTSEEVNKFDEQTSFSKRLATVDSESISPPIITKPAHRRRASSTEREAVKKKPVIETTNSGSMYNSVSMRKSMTLLKTTVIEDEEKMFPFVALERMLPNPNEVNGTYLENSTMKTLNKSISKETLNSSSEDTSKTEMKTDGNARKEHAIPVELTLSKTVQENETGVSINQNTLSNVSEQSISECTACTVTQMKISTPDVPKVALRKLRLKNESSMNNSKKREEGHLSNKENRASNIIGDPKSNDLTVSNIFSQSPQPNIVSNVCTKKSVNENDSIQVIKCLENVNNRDSLSSLNNCEDQNSSSVEMQDDSNQDSGVLIQKYKENTSDTHSDRSFKFDNNKKEQIQLITLADETITVDENDEMCLILEPEETMNEDEEDPDEIRLTQTVTAKCEGNNQAGVSNKPGNLNKSFGETTTKDLRETEVAAKVPSCESITKKPFNVRMQSNNFEVANENENNTSNVIENSDASNVAQCLVEPIDKASDKVDLNQDTANIDNRLSSKEKSIIDSNSQEEKMQVDNNVSDAHVDTDLFQDISTNEWKERNSDKNSVHSMSMERLENESENECDDFVLVDKEVFHMARDIGKEKESSDYDSDGTILLKAQMNSLEKKIVEQVDTSKSECETNENKSAVVKDTLVSTQWEEIIATEANCKNQEEYVKDHTDDVQNEENVSTKTSIRKKVSKRYLLESDNYIEKPTDLNLTIELDETLDIESPVNKKKGKSRLSEDWSNQRKSVCESVEKSDSEVEEPSEVDTADEKDSLSKSPIGSPSNASDSNKTDESMDSDVEREYNLNGVEICKFSDDDVPGDECRASETESSDSDDDGSDLADFVVNDGDEISEEVESSELDEESSNDHDGKHLESEKLCLDKMTGNGEKIMDSEIRMVGKRKKRKKMKRCVEEKEIDDDEKVVEYKFRIREEEIAENVIKKGQRMRGAEEYVEGIKNECADTPKKKRSKLRKTTKLDLPEVLESGESAKWKSKIGTGNKMKKIKAKDNDNKMLKENAASIHGNRPTKYTKAEVSSKRVKRLAEENMEIFSELSMKTPKKRKLLKPEQDELPSWSIPRLELRKRNVNVEQNFIPLSSYGSTSNFYVASLRKMRKSEKTSGVKLVRLRMLNRYRRQPISCFTMYLEMQAASNKH